MIPRVIIAAVAAALASAGALSAAPEVVNLGPRGFDLFWVGEGSVPAQVEVFADAEGQSPLGGISAPGWYPLAVGDPALTPSPAEREYRRLLRERTRDFGQRLVRVGSLRPDTSYYFRVTDASLPGGVYPESGFAEVRTQSAADLLSEALQVVVRFPGLLVDGAVATLRADGMAAELAAVVGDPHPGEAWFNLADLVDALTGRAPQPAGPFPFTLRLHQPGSDVEVADGVVDFTGMFTVARHSEIPFAGVAPLVAYFEFAPIEGQKAGLPFTVSLTARNADGSLAEDFAGTVALTSEAGIISGASTASFVGGVIANHPVVLADTGTHVLRAVHPPSGASGVSNAFSVSTDYASWLEAWFDPEDRDDPDIAGLGADPLRAGVANLERYGFALGGGFPDRSRLPAPGVEPGGDEDYLTLSFRRQAIAPDILYLVEGGYSPGSWSVVEVVLPGEPAWVTVRDSVPMRSAERRFLRASLVHRETYAYWRLIAFAEQDWRQDGTLPENDFGGLGLDNLTRYAFGLDPHDPDPAGLPQMDLVENDGEWRARTRFTRLAAALDLHYVVESSADGQTWQTVTTVHPGLPRLVTVEDTEPSNPASPRQIRVRPVFAPF
ncbi:MAG: hypothetical protein EA425_01550 [Puniceicoccaceae bacterium]|nr:MAG: hypothetical protein EA425_01550 [Puniceicoccaceae bacterium]